MILNDKATFLVLFILSLFYPVLGTSLLWRSTVAFTYLKVKPAKCLCLLPVVLVLRIWSCLHHWLISTLHHGTKALASIVHTHIHTHTHMHLTASDKVQEEVTLCLPFVSFCLFTSYCQIFVKLQFLYTTCTFDVPVKMAHPHFITMTTVRKPQRCTINDMASGW